MSTSSLRSRLLPLALMTVGALLVGPAPDARAGGLRIADGPRVTSESPTAGEPVDFTVRAVFPGEEWIGIQWDFGDGPPVGGITYSSVATSEPSHVFDEPGNHKVICTAYHGYKGGVFGVGPWKYRTSRSLTVKVAPSLPLTIGVLTIDGDKIEGKDKTNALFEISGNVRINGIIAAGLPVVVDIEKKTVKLSGSLTLPGASDYAPGFSLLKDITLDATTGGFKSVDLPNLKAEFEIQGFAAKFENVSIVGAGIQFDFEIKIPRLTKDPSDPEEAPAPDAPLDLSTVFPKAPSPDQLAALSFKMFRIDTVSPYLHALGEAKATLNNVPLGYAGTKYGIDTLEMGVDASQKRYFGTLKLKLPTDRGIGGTFEIREGQWEKVGFVLDGKVPFWTFTGVADAIYLRSLSASVVNLAVLEGQDPRTPMIQAGTFDPGTGTVSEAGCVFEWGPSTNLIGQNILTPIKLVGACTFDPYWNITAAGQLSFFEDVFGDRMRILNAQGAYTAPPPGSEHATWYLRGDLVFDPLFSLSADCTTTFDPNDFRAEASATGTTLLPPDHWISDIVPNVTGSVYFEWRPSRDLNRISFHGYADVPTSYPVLRKLLENKGIGFSYDFATGEYAWQVIDVYTETTPGKAVAQTGTLTNGAGAGGLIVTLRHTAGAGTFSLRLPSGTLLTPADDDDTAVDYIAGAAQSMYVLASAADGTYTAEFDDATLGEYRVEFFAPSALPQVTVGGPATDVSVGRYEALTVPFTASGRDGAAAVSVYLDDDNDGGGVLVASGTAADTSLVADVSQVPAGEYRVVVEALGDDGFPVRGEAGGRVTVVDHLDLSVTKGSLVDSLKAGKDKLSVAGTFSLAGAAPERLFDHETETLHLTLGGDDGPYVLSVKAGDAGWKANKKGVLKWKSPKGATPKVVLTLDPVKRRFAAKVAKLQFVAPPVNPVHCDLDFGSDSASDTRDWQEVKPGRLKP